VAFIESLHLILEEEQFEKILDSETCVHQPPGWSSMGMARNFIFDDKFKESVDLCVFSISVNLRVVDPDVQLWGPNGSFFWDAHPFTKKWKAFKEDADTSHLAELLVARWDPSKDEYVVDYGFYQTREKKTILHPYALKIIMNGQPLPKGPTRLGWAIYQEDVEAWAIKDTKDEDDYLDLLARYGFLENSLVKVEYV
jgi:hypothetical protein